MTPFHRGGPLAFTPLVTLFHDGGIAYDAMEAAVDRQIVAGMDGVILGDVIGEGQTLTREEADTVLKTCVSRAGRHFSVIAATGTNCTAKTIEHGRRAEELGADALLVTLPYYSKPSLKGAIHHIRQVAAAVNIPIIVDDDPGRTAKDYGPALYEGLHDDAIIAGICHGADRLAHFASLSMQTRTRFLHFTRDDKMLPDFLELGGNGAISALANVIPSPIQTMVGVGGTFGGFGAMAERVRVAAAAVGREDVAALKEAMSFIHQAPTRLRLPLVTSEPETVMHVHHAFAPFSRSPNPRVAA